MAGNFSKWQHDMGRKMKWKLLNEYNQWYKYMESGNHTLRGTVISNKIQQFLMIMVPMQSDKRQGTMASISKIRDVN